MDFKDFAANQLLLWTLVIAPLMGVYSYFRLRSRKPIPAKNKRYRTMIAFQCFLILLSWQASFAHHFRFFDTRGIFIWYWLLAASWLAFVGIRLKSAWSRISAERREKARLTLPENRSEMPYWVAISVLAGISEEWAYRGAACALLIRMTGSVAISVLICSIAFGLGHLLHGWRAAGGSALLALVLQLVAFQCQSLILAMVIHACYDLLVGTIAMRELSRSPASIVPTAEPVI